MGLFGGGSGADWLIAGLGNPEPKYDGTRHNTGFAALDALAEAWGCEINKSKWQGLYGIAQVDAKADGASSFMIGTTEFAVPLGNMIDVDAEIARMEAELKHKEGFLQGVLKKLSNEKFVNNAPAAVIEMERKKQADAESIIQSLKESIASLKNV